jgi:plasmid stabilization system protein ParE
VTVPVRITLSAERDIEDAASYYASEGGPALSVGFLQALQEAVRRIESHPLAYQKIIKENRRANMRRFPYGVWFQAHEEETIIFAVLVSRPGNNLH